MHNNKPIHPPVTRSAKEYVDNVKAACEAQNAIPRPAPARVFIFESSDRLAINTAKLQRFGATVYLFNRSSARRPAILDCDAMEAAILQALEREKYNPESDSICVAGPLIAVAQLIAAMISEYGAIKVLFWDSVQNEYAEREIGFCYEAQ